MIWIHRTGGSILQFIQCMMQYLLFSFSVDLISQFAVEPPAFSANFLRLHMRCRIKIFDLARYHMSDLDKIGGVPVVMRESIGVGSGLFEKDLSLEECCSQTLKEGHQIAIWEDWKVRFFL